MYHKSHSRKPDYERIINSLPKINLYTLLNTNVLTKEKQNVKMGIFPEKMNVMPRAYPVIFLKLFAVFSS